MVKPSPTPNTSSTERKMRFSSVALFLVSVFGIVVAAPQVSMHSSESTTQILSSLQHEQARNAVRYSKSYQNPVNLDANLKVSMIRNPVHRTFNTVDQGGVEMRFRRQRIEENEGQIQNQRTGYPGGSELIVSLLITVGGENFFFVMLFPIPHFNSNRLPLSLSHILGIANFYPHICGFIMIPVIQVGYI